MFLSYLLLCATGLASANIVADALYYVHNTRIAVPNGFVKSGPAPAAKVLNLHMNLAQNNIAGLEAKLEDISTPNTPNFRKWLTKAEVEAYAAPSSKTKAAVSKFFAKHGVTKYKDETPAGDWISFEVPVETASRMFDASFSIYECQTTKALLTRTLNYSLPVSLKGLVNTVHPMTTFARPTTRGPMIAVDPLSSNYKAHFKNKRFINERASPSSKSSSSSKRSSSSSKKISSTATTSTKKLSSTSTKSSATRSTTPSAVSTDPATLCKNGITPACVIALYQIPRTPAPGKKGAKGSIGVTAFMPNYANYNDLKYFLTAFRPDMNPNTSFSVTSVDGGDNNDQIARDAGIEANLDIQYTVGIANGVPVDFIAIGEKTQDGDNAGFLDVTNALLKEENPPLVVTTSYGFSQETDLSPSLTAALCNSYMQLTARGVSILFASGDGGVASSPSVSCSDKFPPTFPSCPYVTLVGATKNFPEMGAELSAGGFSNYFPTAKWQQGRVNAYLAQLGSKYNGMFNRTGRAYPDVSAQGVDLKIYVNGYVYTVDGTSASSPIFASIIGLINAELLAAGKRPLGFLNPWMYYNSWAFNDINNGSNPGCGTDGFPALKGWDPVTGLGSPNYKYLRLAAGLR